MKFRYVSVGQYQIYMQLMPNTTLTAMKTFMSKTNVNAATNSVNNSAIDQDPAFDALVKDMSTDKSCVWNSHEIQQAYRDHGGTIVHRVQRHRLLQRLEDYFEGDLLVLSGNGVADILLFRSKAPGILKIADGSSYIDIVPMAKVIRQECSASAPDTDIYKIRLSPENASEPCSDLLLTLLAELSPKLNHTNTAFLIGNIITSVLTNRPTPLQIILGIALRQKSLTELCNEFGITCTYYEVLRFNVLDLEPLGSPTIRRLSKE